MKVVLRQTPSSLLLSFSSHSCFRVFFPMTFYMAFTTDSCLLLLFSLSLFSVHFLHSTHVQTWIPIERRHHHHRLHVLLLHDILQAGVFEVLLVRLACMFDSQTNSMICLNGLVLRRESLHSASNARFLMDSMFDFAERMNGLQLTDHEIGLFCAVVVIAPGELFQVHDFSKVSSWSFIKNFPCLLTFPAKHF